MRRGLLKRSQLYRLSITQDKRNGSSSSFISLSARREKSINYTQDLFQFGICLISLNYRNINHFELFFFVLYIFDCQKSSVLRNSDVLISCDTFG